MKNEMFNFAPRLEDMLSRIRKEHKYLAVAAQKTMNDNDLDSRICEKQLRRIEREQEPVEFELDLREGNADMELYHRISRSIRLLSLSDRKPQEFMAEEADFLFGCPMRYEDFSDDDIEAIRFDPNVEAIDDRTFYYVWIYIGEFDEIKMAAKIDSERGTVHPVPFIPVKSKYDIYGHKSEKPLTAEERKTMIDRIFYASLIPDEIADGNDKYSVWSEDIEDDGEDDVEWIYPDEEYEDDDDEDDDEWSDEFEETDEEDDESFEWDTVSLEDFAAPNISSEVDDEEDTDIKSDDEEEINPEDWERIRLFCESTRDIKVLSVTDLTGNDKDTMSFLPGADLYENITNFVGKTDKIVIGERMYIYHPKPMFNPYCPHIRIHTSPVMFHSEEFISKNEVKHIVRTVNSIYTFIEYKKQH